MKKRITIVPLAFAVIIFQLIISSCDNNPESIPEPENPKLKEYHYIVRYQNQSPWNGYIYEGDLTGIPGGEPVIESTLFHDEPCTVKYDTTDFNANTGEHRYSAIDVSGKHEATIKYLTYYRVIKQHNNMITITWTGSDLITVP